MYGQHTVHTVRPWHTLRILVRSQPEPPSTGGAKEGGKISATTTSRSSCTIAGIASVPRIFPSFGHFISFFSID